MCWCSTRCHSAKLLIGSPAGIRLMPSWLVGDGVSMSGGRLAQIPAAYRATLARVDGQVLRIRLVQPRDVQDLPNVVGCVVESTKKCLLHAVRLSADRDRLLQVV